VVSANIRRRHLTLDDRADAAAAIATFLNGGDRTRGDRQSRERDSDRVSLDEAAELFGVSRASVADAKTIAESGDAELKAQVKTGKVSLRNAAGLVRKKRKAARAEQAVAAATIVSMPHGGDQTSPATFAQFSIRDAAELFGVGDTNVQNAKTVPTPLPHSASLSTRDEAGECVEKFLEGGPSIGRPLEGGASGLAWGLLAPVRLHVPHRRVAHRAGTGARGGGRAGGSRNTGPTGRQLWR
jgi:hypothetical protein